MIAYAIFGMKPKAGMKFYQLGKLLFCFWFSLGFVVICQGEQETNSQVVLLSKSNDLGSNWYSYWIDSRLLPCKVQWEPGKRSFPLELDAEVGRANLFLSMLKQITNQLDLQHVHITRTTMIRHTEQLQQEEASTSIANEWIMELEFLEQGGHPVFPDGLRVVLLLDGTYASERVRNKSHTEYTLSDSAWKSPTISRRASLKTTNAFELVRQPDFVVPAVQWNPNTPFPLDLNAEVARTYNSLVQANHMPPDFVLQEISISRYTPDEAMKNDGAGFIQHVWHWLVAYRYAPTSAVGMGRGYWAYELLDGRVLSVSTPEN